MLTEDLEVPPEEMSVQGRDLLTGKPKQVQIISTCGSLQSIGQIGGLRIEDAVMETLSQTPPELSAADIYNTGIYLAGGGCLNAPRLGSDACRKKQTYPSISQKNP